MFVPNDSGTPEERLGKLKDEFNLSPAIVEALVKEQIQNMEEFRFFWDEEAKIGTWCSKLRLGDDANVQAARLRRAWNAVGLYYRQAEQDRSKVVVSDLDSLLDDSELRSAKQRFWCRYRLRFPTEMYPSDATVSRVSRELTKRMLCVTSVWKVKTLQWQLLTTNKKRKLGDGLFTEEPEAEEPCAHTSDAYLDRLMTLMVAYALAGSGVVAGAPARAEEDQLGADSTKFVEVPLDILFKYHARAKRAVAGLHPTKRLGWLQARDQEERAEWVSRYRESTLSLGTIVKETYEARDAHWVCPSSGVEVIQPAPAMTAGSPKPEVALPSKFQLGPKVGGRDVAKVMRDGTAPLSWLAERGVQRQGALPSRCSSLWSRDPRSTDLWRSFSWGGFLQV